MYTIAIRGKELLRHNQAFCPVWKEPGARSQEPGAGSQEPGVCGDRPIKITLYCIVMIMIQSSWHGKTSKDFQGLGSMAKGASICLGDLFAHGELSEERDLLPHEPNAARGDFYSCEHCRGIREARVK